MHHIDFFSFKRWLCIFRKQKATKIHGLKVFILYTRPLPMCIGMYLNTLTSNNISTLQIQNLHNSCLRKPKQGRALSPNAAQPSSQQVGSGLLCTCDYCCPILCLSLGTGLFSQDDSLASIPAGSWHPINELTVLLLSHCPSKALFTNTGCCTHKGGEVESPPARPVCSRSPEPFKQDLCRVKTGHTAFSRMQVILKATSAFGGKGSSDWYRNRSIVTWIQVSAGKLKGN